MGLSEGKNYTEEYSSMHQQQGAGMSSTDNCEHNSSGYTVHKDVISALDPLRQLVAWRLINIGKWVLVEEGRIINEKD